MVSFTSIPSPLYLCDKFVCIFICFPYYFILFSAIYNTLKMRLARLFHLALFVQLLLVPLLSAAVQNDGTAKQLLNLVDKSSGPPAAVEEMGIKIRKRRGTKLKAVAGGALAGLGGALLYKAFKGKKNN